MTPAEIVSGAFRGVEYAGLLGFVGVVVMRQLARQPPHLSWVRPSMERALALALLGGVTTVALAPSWVGAARVVVEVAALVMCLRRHLDHDPCRPDPRSPQRDRWHS